LLADLSNMDQAMEIAGKTVSVVSFESLSSTPAGAAPAVAIEPAALANVRYTSGSTGSPKGVLQPHRNLLHQIFLYTHAFKICFEDRISVLTSNTGNTITTVFLALLNGAALLPFDVKKNGVRALVRWLSAERISFAIISSPLFRSVCDSLTGVEKFPDLRAIRLASEGAYRADAELFKKHFPPSCILVNGLSSGETNLVTDFFLDPDAEIAGDELPVGYAVEDKEVLLLDDAGRAAGADQIGEIVVRSKYLSPGYWRQPELTNQKFKPDPHEPDKRLYFTGDLGVQRSDGCLIHKGRKDFRVKIRGYGVDLLEVENALLSHPGVREAIVVALPNERGESDLVGYFTCKSGARLSTTELRRHLVERLADFMIPPVFMMLDALPLTANGKLDRNALPAPNRSRPHLETAYAAPRNSTEEELAEIWAAVLSLSQVGIHDNFFELGGHSLAATRVVSRVLKHFQLEIPVQSLFSCPTVAEMARIITQHQGRQLGDGELENILSKIESLSDDEARRLAGEEPSKKDAKD
jgi:acyl-coenzyme A synthetase/AMP-(fatty) acid ligase/acyl carrier protein